MDDKKDPEIRNILNPRVLFVVFEQQDGDWIVKLPHAYGKDRHWSAPISEALSLQFQPVPLTNLKGDQTVGVICYPLTEIEKDGKDKIQR